MTFSARKYVKIMKSIFLIKFTAHRRHFPSHIPSLSLCLSAVQWKHPKPHALIHYTGLQTAGNTVAFQNPLGWRWRTALHCGIS